MAICKLSSEDYQKARFALYVVQDGRCADCGRSLSFGDFAIHHATGRGLGGSFRDDLDARNRGLCCRCHPEADRNRESKFK